jgi:hypothetical protein
MYYLDPYCSCVLSAHTFNKAISLRTIACNYYVLSFNCLCTQVSVYSFSTVRSSSTLYTTLMFYALASAPSTICCHNDMCPVQSLIHYTIVELVSFPASHVHMLSLGACDGRGMRLMKLDKTYCLSCCANITIGSVYWPPSKYQCMYRTSHSNFLLGLHIITDLGTRV